MGSVPMKWFALVALVGLMASSAEAGVRHRCRSVSVCHAPVAAVRFVAAPVIQTRSVNVSRTVEACPNGQCVKSRSISVQKAK